MEKIMVPESLFIWLNQIEAKHKMCNCPLGSEWSHLRNRLETGTHPLLISNTEQEADINKIKMVDEIFRYTIVECYHECFLDSELFPRLMRLSYKPQIKDQALELLDLFESIYCGYGCWDNSDLCSDIHFLKLVKTKREFERILKMKSSYEVSSNGSIRVARIIKEKRTVAEDSGLLDLYERSFDYHHGNQLLAWHNIKETTCLYVYAPIR